MAAIDIGIFTQNFNALQRFMNWMEALDAGSESGMNLFLKKKLWGSFDSNDSYIVTSFDDPYKTRAPLKISYEAQFSSASGKPAFIHCAIPNVGTGGMQDILKFGKDTSANCGFIRYEQTASNGSIAMGIASVGSMIYIDPNRIVMKNPEFNGDLKIYDGATIYTKSTGDLSVVSVTTPTVNTDTLALKTPSNNYISCAPLSLGTNVLKFNTMSIVENSSKIEFRNGSTMKASISNAGALTASSASISGTVSAASATLTNDSTIGGYKIMTTAKFTYSNNVLTIDVS